MSRTFLISAGEVSGDQHAAGLIKAFHQIDSGIDFIGLGGDAVIAEGMRPLHHVRDLAVTGFVEVIKHLGYFRRVMGETLDLVERRRPDAAILIDYPGFNLRLGKRLHALGIPVYYYVSPQVWAWHRSRVKTMCTFIRHMYVLFPFEAEFYRESGIPATFAGHPMLDERPPIQDRASFFAEHDLDLQRPLVGLLPGSRRNELQHHTLPMIQAVDELITQRGDLQFVVGAVSSVAPDLYRAFEDHPAICVIEDAAPPIMQHADVVITSSGTATLETALLETPMVVIYRMNALSYWLGRLLVSVEHLAMPNLIMDDRIVPELIQGEANGAHIASWVSDILNDETLSRSIQQRLSEVRERLGQPGVSRRVADSILTDLAGQHGA